MLARRVFAQTVLAQPGFIATSTVQVRFASLKKTKQRIAASKNIEKITTAMKNVASAKMKGAEQEALGSKDFMIGLNTYLGTLPQDGLTDFKAGKHVIVPITSDRGLCGAVNSTVCRTILADLRRLTKNPDYQFELAILGSKGKDQLTRLHSKRTTLVLDEIQKKNPSFAQACAITDELLARDFDKLTIYYTKFINTGSQVQSQFDLYSPKKVAELAAALDDYETEPDKHDIMEAMYTFFFASNLYHCITTSVASEQASRMVAMDGASRNAKDMIQRLTILFNRTRQAIITGQLIEITSAAESIKA
eukprot:c52275_g1_i1.p1 GENE.c52275_g1_i1~~c52275_g1_i1.p1  ORF type:complete len:306 (-),score=88.01 c52275_g1_i1:148-1065(-)